MTVSDETIKEQIEIQINRSTSVAPREVAQSLTGEGEDWRKLLPRVRAQAVGLYQEGKLSFIRKKKRVSPEGLKGVYRLAKVEEA